MSPGFGRDPAAARPAPESPPASRAGRRGRRAWLLFAGLLALGAVLSPALPADALAWQPERAWTQPWRWWSAAFVHWSTPHLAVNLLGCGVVALFGAVARVSGRATLAWAFAWPLTQLALLAQPSLTLYGGLSGVLHAGVAVAACSLLLRPVRRERVVGAAVLAGLAAKVALEAPWQAALQPAPLLGIDVAPAAHATGALAGLACWTVVEAVARLAACLDRRR